MRNIRLLTIAACGFALLAAPAFAAPTTAPAATTTATTAPADYTAANSLPPHPTAELSQRMRPAGGNPTPHLIPPPILKHLPTPAPPPNTSQDDPPDPSALIPLPSFTRHLSPILARLCGYI